MSVSLCLPSWHLLPQCSRSRNLPGKSSTVRPPSNAPLPGTNCKGCHKQKHPPALTSLHPALTSHHPNGPRWEHHKRSSPSLLDDNVILLGLDVTSKSQRTALPTKIRPMKAGQIENSVQFAANEHWGTGMKQTASRKKDGNPFPVKLPGSNPRLLVYVGIRASDCSRIAWIKNFQKHLPLVGTDQLPGCSWPRCV